MHGFVPIQDALDTSKAYRIRNEKFLRQGHFLPLEVLNSKNVEAIGGHMKRLAAAPADVTYNCKIGRWSDELNQEADSLIPGLNMIIWLDQEKIIFGNGGPPPKPAVVESVATPVTQQPEVVEKKVAKKTRPSKENPSVVEKEKEEVIEEIVTPGAKEAEKNEVEKDTEKEVEPGKTSGEAPSWSTAKRLLFAFGSVGIIGGAIFAAAWYAKKRKLEKNETLNDEIFEEQAFKEQEPKSIVAG